MSDPARTLVEVFAPLLGVVDEVVASTRPDGAQRFRGRVGRRRVFDVIVPPAPHLQTVIAGVDNPREALRALREPLAATARRVKAPAVPEPAPPRRKVTRRVEEPPPVAPTPPPVATKAPKPPKAGTATPPLAEAAADALAPKRGEAVVWREKASSPWERLAETMPMDALWELARGGAQARRYRRGRCIAEVRA